MVLAKQQKKQEGRLAGILRGKTKRAIVSLVAATALTLSMAIPAFAVGGQMQSPGTNIVSGVYQIDVDSTAFTAPSKFWGGDDLIPDTFAVVFRGSTNTSSMSFDMGLHAHQGTAVYGPLYTDGSSSGTAGSYVGNITEDATEAAAVWSSDWVYAFRVCPSATFGTAPNGTAAVGFNWKGCFGTYFDTWDFTFDAASVLGDFAKGKNITLTYYGGYIASQTSRGTSYGANLASTATDLSYGTNTVGATVVTSDSPVGTSYTATADSAGMVTFPGIFYGGNYTIIAA